MERRRSQMLRRRFYVPWGVSRFAVWGTDSGTIACHSLSHIPERYIILYKGAMTCCSTTLLRV